MSVMPYSEGTSYTNHRVDHVKISKYFRIPQSGMN